MKINVVDVALVVVLFVVVIILLLAILGPAAWDIIQTWISP